MTTDVSATKNLERRAAISTARIVGVHAVALFAAAGTFDYWQAWLYIAVEAISMTGINLYLLRTNRELLQRRLAFEERREREPVHKLFFGLLFLSILALLVVAGLDRRFGWSAVPLSLQIVGQVVPVYATWLLFLVLRENSYASSLVEVDPEQTVVSSGPYRWVRHPMYTSMLLGFAASPLALGSYVAALVVVPLCALFVMRLRAEEKFLVDSLPGYSSYMRQTPHRLLPGLW